MVVLLVFGTSLTSPHVKHCYQQDDFGYSHCDGVVKVTDGFVSRAHWQKKVFLVRGAFGAYGYWGMVRAGLCNSVVSGYDTLVIIWATTDKMRAMMYGVIFRPFKKKTNCPRRGR